MNDEPHILDAALREALGGQTPPDLIAATLARIPGGVTPLSPVPRSPAASADKAPIPLRRPWLRWSLATAASVAACVLLGWQLAIVPEGGFVGPPAGPSVAQFDLADVSSGSEDNAGGQFDNNAGGIAPSDRPSAGLATTVSGDRPVGAQRLPMRRIGDVNSRRFKNHGTNAFIDTEDDALSTFALDVDTGSYTHARGYLNQGEFPPADSVRVEEFVNYFKYGYPQPLPGEDFSILLDGAPSRYGANLKDCYLLRVGIKAREIMADERKPATLTFLIDTSGSMEGESRLGLLKASLALLVGCMREGDQIGIVTFGSSAKMHMEYRDASAKAAILAKIDELKTDGSTNLDEGFKVAYAMAENALRPGMINRVILCSDGGANVGAVKPKDLLENIAQKRRMGITLSSIGFGMASYHDDLLEQLGDKGDGHYAYVDSLEEARRIFVENLNGTLQVVARDVKMQLEFNPQVVKSWRLVGYENRDVADKDFRNDSVDGGEVGAGHSVTALYEVKLTSSGQGRIATATVRYKHDERDEFHEINSEFFAPQLAWNWESAQPSLRLAANVAEFAEILRGSFWAKEATLEPVIEDLKSLNLAGKDQEELLALISKAKELK